MNAVFITELLKQNPNLKRLDNLNMVGPTPDG